jgi:hypothetical protein
VSRGTRDTARGSQCSRTGLSPSLARLSRRLRLQIQLSCCGPTTPDVHAPPVWAVPRSLAATRGIAVAFYSSGYLDVSVPRVRSACAVTCISTGRVSPFGNPGINAHVQLPQAYRSLSRPSSPLCAKASTVRLTCLISNRATQGTSPLKPYRPLKAQYPSCDLR